MSESMATIEMTRHEALMHCLQWHLDMELLALRGISARWNGLMERMNRGDGVEGTRRLSIVPNPDPELNLVDDYILEHLEELLSRRRQHSQRSLSPKEMQYERLLVEEDARCAVISGWKEQMVEKGHAVASAILAHDVPRLAELTSIDGPATARALDFQKYKERYLKRCVWNKDYVLASRYLDLGPMEGEVEHIT